MKSSVYTNSAKAQRMARRGFSIIEIALVVIIIALLAGILMVGLNVSIKGARRASEQQMLLSMKMLCVQFKDSFDFLPPLVRDAAPGPLDGDDDPIVRSNDFLEDPAANGGGVLYSEYSLGYYLLGAADKKVDGIDGFGYTKPNKPVVPASGTDLRGKFSKRGSKHEPQIDLNKVSARVVRDSNAPADAGFNMIKVRDRWGNPIRYYRWMNKYYTTGAQKGEIEEFHVPPEVGDPQKNPLLRSAEFAILSLGPDGKISADDIVEVGP